MLLPLRPVILLFLDTFVHMYRYKMYVQVAAFNQLCDSGLFCEARDGLS